MAEHADSWNMIAGGKDAPVNMLEKSDEIAEDETKESILCILEVRNRNFDR